MNRLHTIGMGLVVVAVNSHHLKQQQKKLRMTVVFVFCFCFYSSDFLRSFQTAAIPIYLLLFEWLSSLHADVHFCTRNQLITASLFFFFNKSEFTVWNSLSLPLHTVSSEFVSQD